MEAHDQIFNNLKQSLNTGNCVCYFDNFKKGIIYTDPSPYEYLAGVFFCRK